MAAKRREPISQKPEWERTIIFRGKRYYFATSVTKIGTAKEIAKKLLEKGYRVRIIPKRGGIFLRWYSAIGIYTSPKLRTRRDL